MCVCVRLHFWGGGWAEGGNGVANGNMGIIQEDGKDINMMKDDERWLKPMKQEEWLKKDENDDIGMKDHDY